MPAAVCGQIAGYHPDDPHDPTVAAAQVEEAGGDALCYR